MEHKIVLILVGMSLVTYIPRVLPLVVLTRFQLPNIVLKWLKYIPVAVLSALLIPQILIVDDKLSLSADNGMLLASLPCFFIAAKTKNLFLTVLSGTVCMIIIKSFL